MMDYNGTLDYWLEMPQEKKDEIRWRFFGETTPHTWDTGPYNKAMDAIPILDKGYVALLDHMGTDLDIVNAARISFDKKSDVVSNRDKRLIKYLWINKHTSPFEMVEFKFLVKCPVFVARQWMRHRTWSYNEVSRRYTDENMEFYIPKAKWLREQSENNRQASNESEKFGLLEEMMFNASPDIEMDRYNKLLDAGICREQARMVLPQSMYTSFIAKVDLANLLHFIKLRDDSHAQWEIQQYAEAISEMISPIVPATMDVYGGQASA